MRQGRLRYGGEPRACLATRLAFLVAGFGVASWAPLVPFAQKRLGAGDGSLGLLLLCLGVGSVIAMLFAGALGTRHGSRPIIVWGGVVLSAVLPLLSIVDSSLALGATLFVFGAALGSMDVAMNIHAVEVERLAGRPLMSGFHALFSIGALAGSSLMSLLLSLGIAAPVCCLLCSAAMLGATLFAWPRLLETRPPGAGPLFVLPRGMVRLLVSMAAISFLVEGSVLDWSALLVTRIGLLPEAQAGFGYVLFALAMTAGRLVGDGLARWIGDRQTLLGGSMLAVLGTGVLLTGSSAAAAMVGFLLMGLGLSNIVPILLRYAGMQRAMPVEYAVAAVATAGYAGILVGPAGVGFIAGMHSLQTSFWILAALLGLMAVCACFVTASRAPDGPGVAER